MPALPPGWDRNTHQTEVAAQNRSNKATPNIQNRLANPATDRLSSEKPNAWDNRLPSVEKPNAWDNSLPSVEKPNAWDNSLPSVEKPKAWDNSLPIEDKPNAWNNNPPQAKELSPHHVESSELYPTLEDVQQSVENEHAAEIMAMHGECPSKEVALETLETAEVPAQKPMHEASQAKQQSKKPSSEKLPTLEDVQQSVEKEHAAEIMAMHGECPSKEVALETLETAEVPKPKQQASQAKQQPTNKKPSSEKLPTLEDVQQSVEKEHAAKIMAMHGECPSKEVALETLEKEAKKDKDDQLSGKAARNKEAKREQRKSSNTDLLRWFKGEPRETVLERAAVRGVAFVIGSVRAAASFVIRHLGLTHLASFAAYPMNGLNKAHSGLLRAVPIVGKLESLLANGAARLRAFCWQWSICRLAYRIVLNIFSQNGGSPSLKDPKAMKSKKQGHKDEPAKGSDGPTWQSAAEAEVESLKRQRDEAATMLRNRLYD